jgi:hypothetical protein
VVDATKRQGSLGSDEPSLHEIFEMREDRKSRRVGKRRVDAFVDVGDYQRYRCVSSIEPGEDRFFAPAAMLDQRADETLRLLDRAAVPGSINFVFAGQKQRGHVVAHCAIRGHDDRGRPSHHMVAREQSVFLQQGEGLMVHRVAGRLDADEGAISCLDRIAVVQDRVGRISGIMGRAD